MVFRKAHILRLTAISDFVSALKLVITLKQINPVFTVAISFNF